MTYPPRHTVWDYVLNRNDDAMDLDALLGAKAKALVGHLPIRALLQGGMLRLMPYTVEVK